MILIINNDFLVPKQMYRFYLLIFLIIASSCKNAQDTSKEEQSSSTTTISEGVNVSVQKVISTTFQKQIIANGLAEARDKSELRFKTSERIAKIRVKNGQRVLKGQLLANLDNELLYNQLQRAEIQFEKAKNTFTEEKIKFGQGGKNEQDMDPAILKSLNIRAGVLEAKNQLENAQILYEQTLLKSPFTGIIANIITKEGNFISGNDVFCTVIGHQNMEIIFSVLENELTFVQEGKDVDVVPFIDKNKKYKGKIIEVNPLVDENGLVRIKASIENNDNVLFDGMNVRVLVNQPVENVIVVPKEALVLRSNKEVVFTVKNGLAKWNYVELLDENSNTYAINKGLQLNDTIIVSGNLNLSHDAKVNSTFIEATKE